MAVRADGSAAHGGTEGGARRATRLRERAESLLRRPPLVRRETRDVSPLLEELRVHQVELELQNEQLRSAERELELQNEQLRSVKRELELSRAQYRELFDLAPAGYISLGPGGSIGHANRAADVLLGVDRGSLIRRSLSEFTQGRDLRVLRTHLRLAVHGHHACELSLRRLDGHVIHVLAESRAAPDGGCLTVLTDISERKRGEEELCRANHELEERVQARTRELASRNAALEEALGARAASDAERSELAARLREAERLESLGLLAGGIAHDFNNILVGVMANADLLLGTAPELAPNVRERLATIKRAARSAADLTRQLLVYAGRGQVKLEPVWLAGLIQETLRLQQARAEGRIELRAELAPEDAWIHADAGQVRQVIGNLVANALEAVGESIGTVVLRTRVEHLDAQALARFPQSGRAKPGRFAVLEVEDTGVGIDAAQLPRIFEPFFSSKFTGRGLGLATVLGIVRSHHAALRVRSAPGEGSNFEIAWPLAAAGAVSEVSLAPRRGAARAGFGHVLVVDDDPVVLQALGCQFEQLGFVVTQTASGAEALEVFRARPSQFRLAVVDRTMPGLSGDRVIELLHELEPALPVVLVSGYSAGGPVVDRECVAFVAKPMTLWDLEQAVSRLLEASSRSAHPALAERSGMPPAP